MLLRRLARRAPSSLVLGRGAPARAFADAPFDHVKTEREIGELQRSVRDALHKLIFPAGRELTMWLRVAYSVGLISAHVLIGANCTHLEVVLGFQGAIVRPRLGPTWLAISRAAVVPRCAASARFLLLLVFCCCCC